MFTSPSGGPNFTVHYQRSAFERDLPRVEQGLHGCNPFADTECTLLPITDDNSPAPFCPFYSTVAVQGGGCAG